ncbi:ATP-binding protein [Kineosporia sp. A_224]|jgi:anti-sigma regulatory factor (Ser/Thr protein kinase)|uniref:ATP-binding protein n=1 Tax=Kineosporia sp. A_224 TaxID=1962180 RepID=UPI0013043251|nr:ATP-binding protein [Kineosporia sp. A_224]
MNSHDAARGEAQSDAPRRTTPSSVLRLPYSAAAVGTARRRVRRELADAGVGSSVLDDVEVVVSELLGNAVRHARPIAGGVLLLGWRIEDGEVTVRVTDGGSGRTVEPREAGPMADSGRGLHIIETLASSWGVVEHAGGLRTVWAALPLPSSPRPDLRIVR